MPQKQLSVPYVLEYTYRRSVGPVIGRFLAGLRDKQILGIRTASGRILVPPTEYDPDTGTPTLEWVKVSPVGVITTWAWAPQHRNTRDLPTPFAWALIKLDGADTALLHAVTAQKGQPIKTGSRVRACWRADRIGSISDIFYFEIIHESQLQ